MKYLEFYGLQCEPFRNEPDRAFYFESRAQAAAQLRIVRGLHQRRGLTILIGEVGAGKTTLARHVLEGLAPGEFMARPLVIAHGSIDPGWVLRRIASAFGIAELRPNPIELMGQIYEQLVKVRAAERHAVLILDEAQMLRERFLMEELRSLLNLEHRGQKLLSLVLCGMEELDETVRLDPLLGQLVDIRVRLKSLDEDEVAPYVTHRIHCVQGSPDIFTDAAVLGIARYSEGTPRLINTIADNALFEGFLAKAKPIDVDVIEAVVEQLGLGRSEGAPRCAPEVGKATARAASHDAPGKEPTDPFVVDDSAFDALGWNDPHPEDVVPVAPAPEPAPVVPPSPEPSSASRPVQEDREVGREDDKSVPESRDDGNFEGASDVTLEGSPTGAPAAEEPVDDPVDGPPDEPAPPSKPTDSAILADDSVLKPEKIKVTITRDPPGTDKAAPPRPQLRSAETDEEIDSLFDGIRVGGEDD
ncbi:MAG: AAA family ATPase [Myxococcota bacterium]